MTVPVGELTKRLMLAMAVLLLSACGTLLEVRDDIRAVSTGFIRVAGNTKSVKCPDCTTIVVALGNKSGRPVIGARVFESPGEFDLMTVEGARFLFAFNDLNGDFEFQPNEPFAWHELPRDLRSGSAIRDVFLDILPQPSGSLEWPVMGNLFDLSGHTLGSLDLQLGDIVSLDAARFDDDLAALGMWRPMHFLQAGYGGVYFLEPYSSGKIPILFVHGVGGSPRNFASLIARLDRQRYQPWVFYYPSALDIRVISDGLSGMVSALQHRYRFSELHLVAHSVGGLVSRSYLGSCQRSGNCDYVRSFTSISTPFNGDAAAQGGIDRSPLVVPIWNTLAPGSDFLRGLFKTPLPDGLGHHMLFGFRNTSLLATRSGDEVVPLASQLRSEAQEQARVIRGFDEDHMSILGSEAVSAYINGVFSVASRK